MANIFTIRSTPYSYPSFIHDKGNGLALSLYLCGELNGRYDCSEDVNTFCNAARTRVDIRQP